MLLRQRKTLKTRTYTPRYNTYRPLNSDSSPISKLTHLSRPTNQSPLPTQQPVPNTNRSLRKEDSCRSLRKINSKKVQTIACQPLHTHEQLSRCDRERPELTLRTRALFEVILHFNEQQIEFSSQAATVDELLQQTKQLLLRKRMHSRNFVLASQEGDITIDYYLSVGSSQTAAFAGKQIILRPYYTSPQSEVTLNSFELLRCIGSGGFSKVFLVRFKGNGLFYAMKVISKSFIARYKKQELILNQRDVMVQLGHPMHSKLYWAFESRNSIILVMQFYPGGELFGLIKRFRKMNEAMARFYMVGVLLGLQRLHDSGVAYRDIKPENILLDREGHVHLSDFGLVKTGLKNDASRAYSFCGSPEYMPPEIVARKGHNLTADFYSLGALLYQLVTGLPPFYSRDPEKIYNATLKHKMTYPSSLSSDLKSLLEGLLCKQYDQRLGSRFGVREILSHPWFGTVNIKEYLQKGEEAPVKFRGLRDIKFQEDGPNFKSQQLLEIMRKQQQNQSQFHKMLPNFSYSIQLSQSETQQPKGKNLDIFNKLKKRTQQTSVSVRSLQRKSRLNNYL